MATITVNAGDFTTGDGEFSSGLLVLKSRAHPTVGETIALSALEMVEIAGDDESPAKISDWGTSNPHSPLGLLGALVSGLWSRRGSRKVKFVARFKDGRTLRGTTDWATFEQLRTACQ